MVRFIADEMLGTVAKWLRILGFDTKYAREMEDEAILRVGREEGRVILTRDRELYERALKSGIDSVYLGSADLERDLRKILEIYRADPEAFMSRCTICNSKLLEVDREDVRGKVPEGVYERQERFWYCPSCDKYYWEGSHREIMEGFLRRLKRDYLYSQ